MVIWPIETTMAQREWQKAGMLTGTRSWLIKLSPTHKKQRGKEQEVELVYKPSKPTLSDIFFPRRLHFLKTPWNAQDSATNFQESVQMIEPMGDISNSNDKKNPQMKEEQIML